MPCGGARAPVRGGSRQALGKQGADRDEENFADEAKYEALKEGRHKAREKPDHRVHAEDAEYALDNAREKGRRGVGGKQIATGQGGKSGSEYVRWGCVRS